MAAFLPLMLLPGIVGKFMFIIPFVVTLALLISLLEAFWMMPVHVVVWKLRLDQPSRLQVWRKRFNRRCACATGRRWPTCCAGRSASRRCPGAVVGRRGAAGDRCVRVQFFAFDPMRIIYVNVDMPASATLEDTLAEVQAVEQVVRSQLNGVGPEGEARSVYANAGVKFTDTEPLYGDPYGQVIVSLNPHRKGARGVSAWSRQMRARIEARAGSRAQELHRALGRAAGRQGDQRQGARRRLFEVQAAADALKEITAPSPARATCRTTMFRAGRNSPAARPRRAAQGRPVGGAAGPAGTHCGRWRGGRLHA
jgi:multidrug efflux pump subunit AcrB